MYWNTQKEIVTKYDVLKVKMKSNSPKNEVIELLYEIVVSHIKYLETSYRKYNKDKQLLYLYDFIDNIQATVFCLGKDFEIRMVEAADKRHFVLKEIKNIEFDYDGEVFIELDNNGKFENRTFLTNTIDCFLDYDVFFREKYEYEIGIDKKERWLVNTFFYQWLKKQLANYPSLVVTAKDTPSVQKAKNDNKQPLARHWALFFAYLNPSVFDVKPTIEQFCKVHNASVTAEKVKQHYYKREYNNPKKRAIKENLNDIHFVIEMFLAPYQKEKMTAENEIKDFIQS